MSVVRINDVEPEGESGVGSAVSLLQRVLLPRAGESSDVRSLYLLESGSVGRVHAVSRTAALVSAGAEVSFATYFNAFNAGYWRRWTVLESVVLRVEVVGECGVQVYRSKADGTRIAVASADIPGDGSGRGVVDIDINLAPFEDGGWIWFDITAATGDVRIDAAGWYAPIPAPGDGDTGRVTVGIPTFNRPADAVSALRALASDPLVAAAVDAVLMVDQGTRQVRDDPGFAAAVTALGEKFQLFRQGNLGGSGGYSRIMYEALARTDSPYILFMDDDIAIEPDSILRALAVSRFAKAPMLVGGQMLNLQERAHLHTMGEAVDQSTFMWTAAPFSGYDHDFAAHPLTDAEHSRDLHRVVDVDFNGWWMCMIPRVCAQQIGQPLPLFIKWDDVEYGLRARAAGFPTVSMPGVAVWHMAWSDKDDAIDWQAYFHLRNRLVVAALHQSGGQRAMIRSSLKAVVKHLLCLEYSTVAIQCEAIRDFLAGPEQLFELLPSALPKVAALRAGYPDAVVLESATALPRASGDTLRSGARAPTGLGKIASLAAAAANNLRPIDIRHHQVPQANYSPTEARWFRLGRVDGVTVTTADGRGVVYRQRDRETARALLRDSLTLHRRLDQEFPRLRQRYRAAAAELAGNTRWAQVFGDEDAVDSSKPTTSDTRHRRARG
ncbi:glycosyltransferase [Rhodococcus sp. 4CII]|uniref:glycosyltransferase n=2 Tax=unclassified Rhodococcus (in: high G+C Gram-positive bacteria) TaxID=192944 RepID=UPI0009EC2F73|nr:glycosyltransferase [Rhodococcus sp. 4CII]